MTGPVTFTDELKDRSVRRKAEYDDSNPHDLVLTIAKRGGGQITIPLLKNARSNIEREDYQENTLLRIKPLAEIESALPVSTGYGAPVFQGKAVAMIRPGYLYIYRRDRLWRELEIGPDSRVSDVDLVAARKAIESPESNLRIERPAEGEWLDDVLVPVFLQGQGVMHDIRMAYSEVQWDWKYIQKLETDEKARNARTTGVGHAWAVTTVEGLSFQTGFPASRVEDLPELRARDLGVELMLENPRNFIPEFEKPSDSELCVKLSARLREAQGEGEKPIELDIHCDADEDRLAGLRGQKGLACVALPDPLFKLRHSLAQLQLALHYLDAVDASIQKDPMVHSAMLIRQAVFDPSPSGSPSALANYSQAIDRSKLDEVLGTEEKNHAIRVIEQHVGEFLRLMGARKLDPVLEDYRECRDIAVCEAYLLIANKLDLLQQIPGVLKAQGVDSQNNVLPGLRDWMLNGDFLEDWAPASSESTEEYEVDGRTPSAFERLQKLAQQQTEIDEALLNRLNVMSLIHLEKQVRENDESNSSGIKGVANAGKVGGMISGALNEWSASILAVCKRLIEADVIQSIEMQRIMQRVSSNLVLADPWLTGIDVKSRAGAMERRVIVGVYGDGLRRGLTDFDLTHGPLTRRNDYLYADLLDEAGKRVASTSPSRVAETLGEAIKKVAGSTFVFSAPAGHPEVQKLSLLKVDYAKQLGKVVDGPVVSRGLAVLAAFNVFLELHNFGKALNSNNENGALAGVKLFAGAVSDLVAASFKLSEVMGRSALSATTRMNRIATRPLFDMKNWIFIGDGLKAAGAPTLVRVVGLATFFAGSVGAGLSYWDMRISMSSKDFDAATGHAIAMTGSLVVLASPLMNGLLAMPGWGWAIFGLAMAVGGGLYAGSATDDAFEKLLKRGPWGTHSEGALPGQDDQAYYSQLLTLLSPVQVTAQRYENVEPDPALFHSDYPPKADDYVITLQFPLVSRLKIYQKDGDGLPDNPFRLVVQEVAYRSSTTAAVALGSTGSVSDTQLLKVTPLTKVTARQSLPNQSAVRFLVRREIQDSSYKSLFYEESVTTQVRVGLQATLDTELGPLVFPAPVLEHYEPFDEALHSEPPSKVRLALNPYTQPQSPYWYFTEVST
ncbi:hypothetical protein SAMN05216369_3268 [Marinobacter antarcticus]|uniref:Uncharacterized protein n=1 Tax=Marinobacter antarcticus TaxID=564117 RepID=A0A1M6VLP2_9GAMM|nr:toxin VasX [Marinobacter antarcticus]SHK82271.1 hypothetical protein SAMN05216369_3268 [Marinobacter antarcticus]